MADDGDDVGGGDKIGGGRKASGRSNGRAGSEDDMGIIASGVDWREPLKKECIEAGLPRELGMLMAAVMRARLG